MIVMTLLVRNEQDILEQNIRFHLAQGVDHIIITDNLSSDSTPEIISYFMAMGVVTGFSETSDDYSQGAWVTRMARLAHERFSADWVINADADEFWISHEGSLSRTLAAVSSDVGCVSVARHDFPPIERVNSESPLERMVYRMTTSTNALGRPLPPKACHRGYPDVVVRQGNHSLEAPDVAITNSAEIEIGHFPLRSYEQFENKIRLGGAAYARNTKLPKQTGNAWRFLYRELLDGNLKQRYEAEELRVSEIPKMCAEGRIRLDTRIRDEIRE